MNKRIGIDIDGVLADFNERYQSTLAATSGRDYARPGEDPPCWAYATAYGWTEEEDRKAWAYISSSRYFWRGLNPLPGAVAFLQKLRNFVHQENWNNGASYEIYFITTRPGVNVKDQSEAWLRYHGFENPTVLITRGNKGQLAAGLGLTHFIDDKGENCRDVVQTRGNGCEVFLRHARYNDDAHTGWFTRRVFSLDEFYNRITES